MHLKGFITEHFVNITILFLYKHIEQISASEGLP